MSRARTCPLSMIAPVPFSLKWSWLSSARTSTARGVAASMAAACSAFSTSGSGSMGAGRSSSSGTAGGARVQPAGVGSARSRCPANVADDRAHEEPIAVRAKGQYTVPGRLDRELGTNPFLRFDDPNVARGRDPVASFTAIRGAKDNF